jgi:ABC-2 type transport system ATP-binding protein
LLATILSKSSDGGNTQYVTTSAALPDVIPVGALDVAIDSNGSGAASSELLKSSGALGDLLSKQVDCSAGAKLTASAKASMEAKVGLDASWGPFSGVKAKFTGSVTAGLSVGASVSGYGKCSAGPYQLSPTGIPLGAFTFTVGPVPVYVAVKGNAAVTASANATAEMSTSASASATASAGIKYDGGFRPFGGFTHTISQQAPKLTAAGSAQVNVNPRVDLLIYGVAGPRVDFNAGLKLSASNDANPWWKLTAPMDLGASLNLEAWKLHLSSGRLKVWSAEPVLAQADTTTTPDNPPGTPDNPLVRAQMDWNTDADIDLHIWDEDGNHTYFLDLMAIPDAALLEDIIPGYGPEIFQEFGDAGRKYTYGLCNYTDSDDLTTAHLVVTDPGGATREFDRDLPYQKAATSPIPAGATPTAGTRPRSTEIERWARSHRIRRYVPEPAILIEGLRKSYDDFEAVKGVDLTIETGQVFAILGPNGAGKTTTVEILEGYRQRSSGVVTVLGEDPGRPNRAWRERIGIVLQESEPTTLLTVRETITMYAGYYADPRDVEQTIGLAGLSEKADTRAGRLSGGQKRRLDVALALIGDPDLIFLDEPTTGFDPEARREAWDVIASMRDLGKTILLTTHYMEEAQRLADQIAVFAGGEIVAQGTPNEIGGREQLPSKISFQLPERIAASDLPPQFRADADDSGLVTIESTEPTRSVNEITTWALDRAIELEDLAVARPSLEDIYLRLTRVANPDEEPGA